MVTKETKSFKTIETLRERERERESLNLSQLGLNKCAQNEQFSKVISYIKANKKDRLACGRCKERINLLHDSLSFL